MRIAWNKGKTGIYTQETLQKMRDAKRGYVPWVKGKKNPAASKRMSEWNKTRMGILNPNWKGGITEKNRGFRHTAVYLNWRKTVLKLHDYRCLDCGERAEKGMEVDHIFPFAYFPRLRLDINNGRVLCKACHIKTPTYSRRYKP